MYSARRMMSLLIWLLLSTFCVPLCADSVFQWKDAEGVPQYGDQPPDDRALEKKIQVNPRNDPESQKQLDQRQKSLRAHEQLEEEKAVQEAKASKRTSEKEEKCGEAQKLSASYSKARALYRKDESGNRVMASDADRAAAVQEVQDYLAKYCQ